MIPYRIGRHSKSLDTQRFVCALCTGQLVLLTPSKPRAPTPFANFVKENYSSVRQELAGQSHAEVMRKLSADFASKTKLSQSWASMCPLHRQPMKYLSQIVLHYWAAMILNVFFFSVCLLIIRVAVTGKTEWIESKCFWLCACVDDSIKQCHT